MNNLKLILPAAILVLSACSQNTRTTDSTTVKTDTTTAPVPAQTEEKRLFATMQMEDTVKTGDRADLKFTVYNHADSTQQFCKWHTPFEPLISKYLDVKDENGQEVNYKGAMAKRIMPPPASSYLKVNAKDSTSVTINLLDAYAITKPARYTIVYVGQNMSGLIVKDSISFVYLK